MKQFARRSKTKCAY